MERDEEDSRAFHILAYDGKHAIGTGRLVELGHAPDGAAGQWGKVGRMAVLALSHRKSGTGSKMLTFLETEARRQQVRGHRAPRPGARAQVLREARLR